MTPLPDAVAEVLGVAGRLADDGPLRAAAALWTGAPWRVAVVGRVSVGKSTLINALAGRRVLKTGLGGVTTAPAEVGDGPVWIDTPGLDGAHRDAVIDVLPTADAIVWVVDGLQPMTSTEREALAMSAGQAVHVVVSRADRIEAEVDSVLDRVRTLAAPWDPITVRAADLRAAERHGDGHLADLAEAAPWRSVRRRKALIDALVGLQAAVAALPAPPDRSVLADALVARWRQAVRDVEGPVAAAIRAGRIESRALATRWFNAAAIPAAEAFVATAAEGLGPLRPATALDVGLPAVAHHGPIDVAGGLGGAGAALREVRRAAAAWLLDGEIALREWVLAATGDPGLDAARATLAGSIPAALKALDSGAGPMGPTC